jgi:predicted nucleic acid-binding protein
VAWKRIVNASPLIFLTRLGLLDVLNEPGTDVRVPEAVLAELSFLDPDDPAAIAARSTRWIQVVPTPPIPDFIRAWQLGAGETSVLTLALAEIENETAGEKGLDVVLDDARPRRCAQALGLRVQGTLAFLLIAKATGRIEAVRPLLERLHSSGMHVSRDVMLRVLTQAGE